MPRWDVHFDLHIDLSDSRMVRLVESDLTPKLVSLASRVQP